MELVELLRDGTGGLRSREMTGDGDEDGGQSDTAHEARHGCSGQADVRWADSSARDAPGRAPFTVLGSARAEPPEVFRATSAILPIQPGSIASARAPDPGRLGAASVGRA